MGFRGVPPGGTGMIPGGPLGRAKYELAAGNAAAAERIVRKRLQARTDDVPARVLLAQILLQMQQPAEAAREARVALRYQPKHVEALMMLSSALSQQGGFRGAPKEAETSARRAVELEPNNANARVQLAEILLRSRDSGGAREEVEKAAKLEPRSPGVQLMRALVLLTDKDYEGAIQSADAALRFGRQLAPSSLAQADFIKSNALMQLKRYDESLAALNEAERRNPLLVGTNGHSMRGRIYFKQRKFKESYNEFLTAQRLAGRLLRFAPILAGVNMVLAGLFGENAPFVLFGLVAAIIVLILAGVSYIPVAGPWVVMVLVLALAGFFAVMALRQLRGRVLPEEQMARLSTIAVILASLAVGAVVTFLVERLVTGSVFHSTATLAPLTAGIAGVVAIVLAAVLSVGWQGLIGRYGGMRSQAAA